MSKKIKISLVVAICFMLLGGIIFVGAMSFLKWDFVKLGTTKYETNTYIINEQFENVSINADTADIIFLRSSDQNCKIECIESATEKHTAKVLENTLKIEKYDTGTWYDHITVFCFGETSVKVYLPDKAYASLAVKLSTGDIDLKNINAGNINVSATTGDIEMENVIATQNFNISGGTGDIELERCDADEIYIKTSTGDVEGSLLTEKVFVCDTSTGDIDVPQTTSGGKCEITTSTGDIEFEIVK